MQRGFICPNLSGHLHPMTALARQLQGRRHDIIFLYSSDAAGLPSIPDREKDQFNEIRRQASRMQRKDALKFGMRC
jgi:UDP:flavonoid glycosyltransferase YjiC (YdhE family)